MPDAPLHLMGGRHRQSGRITFPHPGDGFDAVALPSRGTLWSYTVQRFRPKSPPYAGPEIFEPWALAYVELPGAVIVEARLVEVEFDAIRIGMALELTKVALDPAASAPVWLPAFRPATEDGQ
ncbi:Zn-ribbon domain-containing OB-fold protein [Novosphingobium humi]|uniref:Zn-ribbon domain-containing OB-fold protein n=1 Tax=Novosphingobium humi TaxID=2282397 RepID=UPI0025B01981|nr:OB-fold domain-containing protein [Novosphingobium humi]WJT01137.1 OB-fold domain-containing protein [Novosphingobium humi]